jgi:tetratricopeptide (TPR) repeat protein
MAQTTKETLTKKEKKIFEEAKTYAKSGALKKSNDKFLKLLSAKPDFTEAYLRLASNYYQQKSFLPAEENFKKAINLQPDFDPEMYYSLAMVQTELKKHAEAADQLDIYIHKAKDKPEKVKKATKQRDNLRFITFALKTSGTFSADKYGRQYQFRKFGIFSCIVIGWIKDDLYQKCQETYGFYWTRRLFYI